MYRETVWSEGPVRIVLMDSMSQVEQCDTGAIVVAGSNGGQESGNVGVAAGCGFVLLNDAGVGKDRAGISGLATLQEARIPAATVGHDTAEISDARDMWVAGVVSHVNPAALAEGVAPGDPAGPAVLALARRWAAAHLEEGSA
ncbi:hypothetical protein ACWZJV_21045 [Nocardioides sp. WG-D5]